MQIRLLKPSLLSLMLITPVYGYEVGIGVDNWQATIADDPAGDVKNDFNAGQLTVFGQYPLGYYHRLKVSVSELDIDFKASPSEVGQEGTGTQIEGQYQRRIEFNDQSFFAGAGLAYRDMEYNSRQTVQNNGFLEAQFFDVEREEVSLVLTAEKEWVSEAIHDKVMWGVDVSYYQPIDEGLRGIKVGFSVGYTLGN